ncbi:MAG: hypothetical protein GVY04_13775 [Cyanobacteria bacterium]|jgi:hypothetical protein|nr:hypothetical protein [Cyanobacteria bacterium GSL.Bin1]
MDEMSLILDVLQCWYQQRLSRDQSLEVLVTIARSPRGRSMIEQVRELLGQALEEFS